MTIKTPPFSSSSFSPPPSLFLLTTHSSLLLLLFLILQHPLTLLFIYSSYTPPPSFHPPLPSSPFSLYSPSSCVLAQFSLYVHKGGLKPDSFHFSVLFMPFICLYTQLYSFSSTFSPPSSPCFILISSSSSFWAAFHASVRGSVPGLGGLKETKCFFPIHV